MSSPIQIILNDRNYEQARDVGGGGPKKDFFAKRDKEFRQHKVTLMRQLTAIATTIEGQAQGDVAYIKVILRRSAWAKSHRPLGALFKPSRLPLVGGGDLGEMYFEARPAVVRDIATDISKAEEQTRFKEDDAGREIPNPSTLRSETGAIEKIDLYGPQDRRNFSVDEGISWLSNPMTGSSYEIELFDVPPPQPQWDAFDEGKRQLYTSFVNGLAASGQGLTVQRQFVRDQAQPLLSVRLSRSTAPATLQLGPPLPVERRGARELAPFDPAIDRHRRLLRFLDNHPLVRHVDLPPVVVRTPDGLKLSGQSAASSTRARPAKSFSVPARSSRRTYPRLGVIDGGISPELSDWVIGQWDVLDASDMDHDHGTFIGGLAVVGNTLNGSQNCPEPDGAEIADLAVYPSDAKPGAFRTYYPDGPSQLFDEIDYAVSDAKARHKVRVFNMSLNIHTAAQPNRYSHYAARLDQIAEQNDAVFFVPTGNTTVQDSRPEWLANETNTLVGLASSRNDGLLMPAESVRNVAVAALNPAGVDPSIAFAPARYSRRGPGLRAGVKPDLACVGGCGSAHNRLGHGLFSIVADGTVDDACGTSFAAPLAAKAAAVLEQNIEGTVSRETLIALLLHHAQMPEVLRTKAMRGVARHLVGFGKPPSAKDILDGDDHQITLVFASRLRKDQQIAFRFTWPPSMVLANGECRGSAKLTLVSTPPLDPKFGSEFVRINIDAALQQEDFDKDGKPGWRKRLDAVYLPGSAEAPVIEAESIEHGLKWSPNKAYARTMPRGVGKSSNWRLFINYLTRAGEEMPPNGVPFTAILTISDPTRRQPVFTEMRQSLQVLGVRIEDIRTAARVATRV